MKNLSYYFKKSKRKYRISQKKKKKN